MKTFAALRRERAGLGAVIHEVAPNGQTAPERYLRSEISPDQTAVVSDRPRVRTRQDGYGARLPTDRAALVAGSWRRVWVVCWGSYTTEYVDLTKAERARWPGRTCCVVGS